MKDKNYLNKTRQVKDQLGEDCPTALQVISLLKAYSVKEVENILAEYRKVAGKRYGRITQYVPEKNAISNYFKVITGEITSAEFADAINVKMGTAYNVLAYIGAYLNRQNMATAKATKRKK